MTLSDAVIGETVYYFLPRAPSNGRSTDWYLACRVVNVTAKRVVVQVKSSPTNVRVLAPNNLHRSIPEGAVIK